VKALALLWRENADTIFSRKCVVELANITPKEKADNGFSAEISVVLPEIQMGPPGNLPTEFAERLQNELTRLIQPMADYRFGSKGVQITCKELRSGSLEFMVIATAIGGGTYKLVKDYDKLRGNAVLFTSDLRRACCKIKWAVLTFLGNPENPFQK
jgi:hypothetical protein